MQPSDFTLRRASVAVGSSPAVFIPLHKQSLEFTLADTPVALATNILGYPEMHQSWCIYC
jgi:hypothetical protein